MSTAHPRDLTVREVALLIWLVRAAGITASVISALTENPLFLTLIPGWYWAGPWFAGLHGLRAAALQVEADAADAERAVPSDR